MAPYAQRLYSDNNRYSLQYSEHPHKKANIDIFAFTFIILLSSIFSSARAYDEDLGMTRDGTDFCYDPDSNCGPAAWGGFCQSGTHQSPISLPNYASILPGGIQLHSTAYRTNSFRMRNNGHTVQIEFLGDSGSTKPVGITKIGYEGDSINYILDSFHFHWGPQDNLGSEHEFEGSRRFSMELHLVHFRNSYDSTASALKSNDSNALAVIGIMLNVSRNGADNPIIAPITKQLSAGYKEPTNDWTYVKEPLDFTALLPSTGAYVYTYKGSLTTPGCDEKVNWNVYSKPAPISHEDVQTFRNLYSHRGHITDNHRPLQARNGRSVFLTPVTS